MIQLKIEGWKTKILTYAAFPVRTSWSRRLVSWLLTTGTCPPCYFWKKKKMIYELMYCVYCTVFSGWRLWHCACPSSHRTGRVSTTAERAITERRRSVFRIQYACAWSPINTVDATQLDSWVTSASAVCIRHKTPIRTKIKLTRKGYHNSQLQ